MEMKMSIMLRIYNFTAYTVLNLRRADVGGEIALVGAVEVTIETSSCAYSCIYIYIYVF